MPEDNLPELRDIHLPDGVSAFPPAYGWWVVLAGILIAVLLVYLVLLLRRKSKKLYALYLLNKIPTNDALTAGIAISAILRRICVFKYKEAAVLSGEAWLKFLNSKSKHKLSGEAAELLLVAPYVRNGSQQFTPEDAQRLKKLCRDWIGANL